MKKPGGQSAGVARRPDAAQTAYEELFARIAAGTVAPGARLKESALAESLGMSRTPVREALRRLAAEGLVELQPNRGAQLATYSPSEVADLFSVRVALEPRATALAVPRFSNVQLREVEELAEQMTALVESRVRAIAQLGALNERFHQCFLQASANRVLVAAVTAAVRPAVVNRTFNRYSEIELRRSMAHHSELVTAARARDAEWAESVMRTHLLAARHTAVGLIGNPPGRPARG